MSKYSSMKCFGFNNLDDVLSVVLSVEKNVEDKVITKRFVMSRCAGGWKFNDEINFRKAVITSDETAVKCLNDFLDDIIFLKDNGIVKSVKIEIMDTLTSSFEFKFL